MELTLDQALQKGIEAHKAGQVQDADRYYTAILKANPKHPDANHNLGVLAVGVGKAEEALPFFKTALEVNSNIAQYWLSYIDALIKLDRIADAKEVFEQAKSTGAKGDGFDQVEKRLGSSTSKNSGTQEPSGDQFQSIVNLYTQGQYQEALTQASQVLKQFPNSINLYNIIGAVNKGLGKLDEAIEAYKKALTIKPDYPEAYNNMGVVLQQQGKLDEAIEAYNKALSLKPDYAEAYYNMGSVLRSQGKLDEALEAYNSGLAIKPDYAKALSNMGNVLQDQGKLEEAIEVYNKVLSINLDVTEVWNNLYFPLQAIKFKQKSDQNLNAFYPKDINSNYGEIELSILDYRLHLSQENAERYLDQALLFLSSAENIIIKNPKSDNKSNKEIQPVPDKMVALVHFGRSGTGLMHSLIDGHPEISTLPSIYFSEYFDHSNWNKLTSSGWDGMIDRFISIYEVLFDATSSVPIEGKSKKLIKNIGIIDGMANVGDQRNEALKVDKGHFRKELKRQMACYDELDVFVFFKLVHIAYDKAVNDFNSKSLIFYHIHNPDTSAQLNFARFNPDASWLLMVREPIQSLESWIRTDFTENDYFSFLSRVLTMLFEIDNIVYHKQDSIAVRLEDLKERPRKTIPALCKWMGIKEEDSLYEMTAQGKKWWGDPSSVDYSKDGMEPFGKTSISRKIGSIFSENDQFILRTLFYPFSVRFGYTEENEKQFKVDLQKIRPMLDETFDFEKKIVAETETDPEFFMKSGSYLYFRSCLIERLNTLTKFGTYPNMIRPLQIS